MMFPPPHSLSLFSADIPPGCFPFLTLVSFQQIGVRRVVFTLNYLKSAAYSLIYHRPILADPRVHGQCVG